MQLENELMELIVYAGNCRSLLMQSLMVAKQKDFEKATYYIEQAEKALKQAHSIQTSLISQDEGEGKLPVSIIMVHAQDHVMNAVLLLDITKELVELYRR